MDIPLFLLHAVLFPGGRLALKVFETRYLDMVRACLRLEQPFGVCRIAQGTEVLQPGRAPAVPAAIGTLAQIDAWDAPSFGILDLEVLGTQRFRILRAHTAAAGLVRAEVELLPASPVEPVPRSCAPLVPLLRQLVAELGERAPPAPHRFYDAGWVADRYAELLPIPLKMAQELLETESGGKRLMMIRDYLESH
ncbi:MAG: LON peptidase substrate-binding domain-containing protein [Rhodocyclaceae bacterium]|nr:LON peptidase substrate-binding domain-containing protein [Rhodocyclaceae bacterium]